MIKRIHDITLEVLRENKDLVNNTGELQAAVDQVINAKVNSLPYGVVMKNRKALGLPPLESVSRARRKIVNDHPELRPDADVDAYRGLLEDEYKDYAKE